MKGSDILSDLVPPAVFKAWTRLTKSKERRRRLLFGGEIELFWKVVGQARVYGEYGCGKSTRWVMANTTAKVIAVDSDPEWIEAVRKSSADDGRLRLVWADIGDVGAWGMPASYARRDDFETYVEALWRQEERPDVVLVDGRFRICCFLTALRRADPGARIIFDDYVPRPHFHVVEEFVKPVERNMRQALFVVPPASEIDMAELDRQIDRFRYVLD